MDRMNLEREALRPGNHISFLYHKGEELKKMVLQIQDISFHQKWKVLYLTNQHKRELIQSHLEGRAKNWTIRDAKDYYLSKDNFYPKKGLDVIGQERKEAQALKRTTFVLILEVESFLKEEKKILELEFLLKEFASSNTLIICQYYQKIFPFSFLLKVLLVHNYVIIHHHIYKNPKPQQHERLEVDFHQSLYHFLINNLQEMRDMEEGIQWSRDLCLTLFEEFPNPLFLSNAKGDFVDFNNTWLTFTGKSLKEEKGQGWISGIHEKDRDYVQKRIQVGIEKKESFDLDFRLTHHSGEYRNLLCAARPLFNSWNGFAGFLFSNYDITNQREKEKVKMKELEKELKNLQAISQNRGTSITADSLGLTSIKAGLPDIFESLLDDYQRLMEGILKEKIFGENKELEKEKKAFINKLGFLQASPRDLMEIHSQVLEKLCNKVQEEKVFFYVHEGRILALEIMGYLASYYRKHCTGYGKP